MLKEMPLGEAAGQLHFQRVIGGEIVGVEHVEAGELRVRNEDERLSGGELGHRDAVLQARGDGSGQRAHRVQSEVGGDTGGAPSASRSRPR